VDEDPIIRSVNAAFESVFGGDEETLVGADAEEVVLPADESTNGGGVELEARTREGEVVVAEVRRQTCDENRTFLFRGIPYGLDGESRAFGVYTDITEQKTRERYLKVINRVLRHNLRNDLNVIIGFAELIEQDVDDEEIAERATVVRSRATALARISDEAKVIEELTKGIDTVRDIDVATIVGEVADEYRASYPDATVLTDVPDSVVVRGTTHLRAAVANLVENAIVHNDSEIPRVRISVGEAEDDEWVTLRVLDNGPGIPQQERDVILGSTEITQLEHGSGLGLWLVKWTVESVGGEVDFDETETGVTAVTLRLQSA
ncbi:MAG: ATP-binding protein, partial [Halobacteriota archaeon]